MSEKPCRPGRLPIIWLKENWDNWSIPGFRAIPLHRENGPKQESLPNFHEFHHDDILPAR
jgi:hypothetical protein